MKPNKKIFIRLGLSGLLILLMFGLFLFQSQTYKDFTKYQVAKQKWENRTFSNYRLVVSSKLMGCIYDVEIQNEMVIKINSTDTCPSESSRETITDLFANIKESISQPDCIFECGCEGRTRIEADYDSNLGYPKSIQVSINKEWRWLYPKYWTDKIGQRFGKYCPPNCKIACNPLGADFFDERLTVQLLQASP